MSKTALRKIALLLSIMGVVLWLPFNLVYCVTNPVITLTCSNNDRDAVGNLVEIINSHLADEDICSRSGLNITASNYWEFFTIDSRSSSDSINIIVDMTQYKSLGAEIQQRVMQIALEDIYNSDVSRSNRNKIYNDLCSFDETTSSLVRQLSNDVRADFVSAYASFKPFSSWFGWLFGCIALGMFITLGLSIIVDISYINLPFIQVFLTKDAGKKPKLVSVEAWSAVMESDSKSGSEYVSPNGVYLRHKIKQYVMVIICLLYLTSGRIFELVATAMDYFRGFLG